MERKVREMLPGFSFARAIQGRLPWKSAGGVPPPRALYHQSVAGAGGLWYAEENTEGEEKL